MMITKLTLFFMLFLLIPVSMSETCEPNACRNSKLNYQAACVSTPTLSKDSCVACKWYQGGHGPGFCYE